jgi:hypothetical protein
MKSLKEILLADQSKKTKAALIEMLTNLEELITPAEYEKVSGILPSELEKLTRDKLLEIVDNFKKNYSIEWEKTLNKASKKLINKIFGKLAADSNIFAAQSASDADFAAELGSIDFATIIGGPLDACVKAQANSSLTTVNFIKEVGFETTGDGTNAESKIRMVDFSYKKETPNPNVGKDPASVPAGTDVTSPTIQENVLINVPFISILNIPSFRIETCQIDFNVKLSSTFTRDVKDDLKIGVGAQGGWGPVKFKVDVSYQRTSSTGIKVEKEYSLAVKVQATNDEMPKGLEKVLGLLSA